MDNYFNSIEKQSFNNIPYIHVGKPILLLSEYDKLLDFTSGRYKIDDNNRWIYFNIIDFESVSLNKTNIIYEIDPYLTYLFDSDNNKFTFGYTQCLKRSPIENKPIFEQNIPMKNYEIIEKFSVFEYDTTCIFFVLSQMKIGGSGDYTQGPFYCCIYDQFLIKDNKYIELFKAYFTASDILGAWYVPFSSVPITPFNKDFMTIDPNQIRRIFYYKPIATVESIEGIATIEKTIDFPYKNENLNKIVVNDEYGNILFTPPLDTELKKVMCVYRLNATNCQIDFIFNYDSYNYDNQNLKGLAFTYACKTSEILIDSEAEYNARNKQYEKEIRLLQNQQNVINNLSSVGSNAIGGGIAGGLYGALAGGALGLLTTGISYISNDYFNNRELGLIQNKYNHQQDYVNIAMSGSDAILSNDSIIVTLLHPDIESYSRQLDIFNTDGYTVSEIWEDGELLYQNCNVLTCIPTIIGKIPLKWKIEISNKFANGVIFEDVI